MLQAVREGQTINIVLVEDDDGDAKAVRRAFGKSKIGNPFIRACDGVEALEILRGENGHQPPPEPFILLVDINMPRMDGIELVANLRADPRFKRLLVFILTTSKSEEDKARAYDLNVAGYIVKETAGMDFLALSQLLESYCQVVEIPKVS